MYQDRFIKLKFLLAVIGTVAVCGFLYSITFAPQTRVETKVKPEAPLSNKSSVADVRKRFGKPLGTAPFAQLGLSAENCPSATVYQLSDGAVLVCHG